EFDLFCTVDRRAINHSIRSIGVNGIGATIHYSPGCTKTGQENCILPRNRLSSPDSYDPHPARPRRPDMLSPTIPHPPSGEQFAPALETCRQFLLAVANVEMPGHLVPKGGASDLVQETLMNGYLHQTRFRGSTLAELRAWLRGILLNELATFRR